MIKNDSPAPHGAASPFERLSQRYIDNGLPVLPIAPGTKMPGEYAGGRWRGMNNWRKYSVALPSELELDLWQRWPDAGIGLLTGALSGVVCADIDTEDKFLLKKLNDILPPSPLRKKGKKGWSGFYRYNGEINKSWRVNGKTVLDLLSDGRQTLLPGTIHPDGMTYIWLTEDTLDNFDLAQLPELPKNFADMMARMIEPLMTEDDRKHLKNNTGPTDIVGEIAPLGFAASIFREINTQALLRLDEWVPKMVPTAKPSATGYRCKAFWRGGEGLNVGIVRSGIKDFVGDYGMTPIDLVMHAQNVTLQQAADALRYALNIPLGENPLAPAAINPPPPAKVSAPLIVQPRDDEDPLLLAREAKLREEAIARQEEENAKDGPDFVLQAPGMLGRIVGWMTETAPKYQPELFVAAAIAVGATAMGRLYRSNLGNWTNMYMVMVAKTGEGKEHPMQCASRILAAAGLDSLVAGSGYTSSGAVHSALMRSPAHLAIIDEMGKMLKLSRSSGAAHSEAAIDKLVEAYSKCDSFMKPAVYSTMSMNAQQVAGLGDKTVYNPCISLLGATTPATFYDSLTPDLIKDGFLGRLLVVHSKRARQKTRLADQTPPPEDVVAWVRSIVEEGTTDLLSHMNPLMPAKPIVMVFDEDSRKVIDAFDDEALALKNQHDGQELDGLLARTREKAMRLAMIAAKATNPPRDNTIRVPAVRWAIDLARHYDLETIRAVIEERSESQMQALVKRAVKLINAAKSFKSKEFERVLKLGGMPHSKLARDLRQESKLLRSVIETAIEQGFITRTEGCPEAGFGGLVYWPRANPFPEDEEND